jgi:DNA-binding MarR family transcriptional regulator
MSVENVALPSSPCLCESLRKASRAVTRMYDDALRPAGLRVTQFSVLARLESDGKARVRDLSAALFLEETTLTRSVATLEKNGWVASSIGDDQRERYLSITPAGRKVVQRAFPLWKGVQKRIHDRVSTTTWDGLFRSLPRVTSAAAGG